MIYIKEANLSDLGNDVSILRELEDGTLMVNTPNEWRRLLAIVSTLKHSQGYYSRLYRYMQNLAEDYGGIDNIPYPVRF